MRNLLLTLDDYATALDAARTVEHVWDLSVDFAGQQGFDKLSYHSVRAGDDADVLPGLHVAATGYPEGWKEHYVDDRLYLVDPITRTALASTEPLQWSDVSRLPGLDTRARAYLKHAHKAGIGDGLAVQAFGPNLRSAYVGLGFVSPPSSPLGRSVLHRVSAAAQMAHLAVCRIDDTQNGMETARLSPRETEVLALIARGLSTARIAEALAVSRHTVDALQRRIFTKLDVSDRTSAVVRGLASGMIHVPVIHAVSSAPVP